jgi:hypothetical protein
MFCCARHFLNNLLACGQGGTGGGGEFHSLLIAVHTLHIQRGHSTITFLMKLIRNKFDKKYISTADSLWSRILHCGWPIVREFDFIEYMG